MSSAAIHGAPQTATANSAAGTIESKGVPTSASAADAASQPAQLTGGVRRIVLTGFMGAGKSAVGRRLAAQLGWAFLDLDAFIEQRTGLSVPRIFAEQGEPAFRHIESVALAVALGRHDVVIALGGGTPEQITNRLLLEQTPQTLTAYLHAPLELLIERCLQQNGGADRPILAMQDALASRFESRLPHYRRLASITIDTACLTIEETALHLCEKLQPGI